MPDATKATPRPWRVYRDHTPRNYTDVLFVGVAGPPLTMQTALCGKPGNDEAEANAALIVAAVNSHDDLVAALEKALMALDGFERKDVAAETVRAALTKARDRT